MANYTAADVKKLRELTGAGMMDCKKALDEADGDVDKAVEILRIKGQKGVAKREGRTAEQRRCRRRIADDKPPACWSSCNCETDFVAKGEQFQSSPPTSSPRTSPRPPPADLDGAARLRDRADGKTVQAYVDEANADLGEKIVLDRFAQFSDGYVAVVPAPHACPDLPPQVGVLVELDRRRRSRSATDIAQHIAAFAPKYLSRDDVPAEVVETERRVAEETTREEGKPEAALPKIVEGRVNGFFKDDDAARPAVRAGQQEVRPEGPGRGRCHPEALRPLQGRHLSRPRRRRPR